MFVYVVGAFSAVTVIRTSDQTVFDTITLSPNLGLQNLAITPSGEFVYLIGQSQFIPVMRTSDNNVIDQVTLMRANFSLDIVIAPTSDFVYVISNQVFVSFGTLNVIDVSTNTVIKQIEMQSAPQQLAINTSGSRVYVSNRPPARVDVVRTSDNTLITSVPSGGNLDAQGIAVTTSILAK